MNYFRDEGIKRLVAEATGAMSVKRLKLENGSVVYYNYQKKVHRA